MRPRTTSSQPPQQSPKELYQAASTHFLHRQHAPALGALSQLLGRLPQAPANAWAADLPAKTRTAERWRTKAVELMLTAEVMLYKATPKGSAHDPQRIEEHYAALERRAVDLFTPSPVPPTVILTLARSCSSLGLPTGVARQSLETWQSSIAPELLPALAVGLEDEPNAKWVVDAVNGYEGAMEYLWLETSEGEAAREEARRLVDWDQVLSEASKTRIRTRLDRPPTPPAPPPPALPTNPSELLSSSPAIPEADAPDDDCEGESSVSASVPSTASGAYADADDGQSLHAPAGVAQTLTNRSAYTGSMPPSPTLSARTLSPAPPLLASSSRVLGVASALVGRLRRAATPVSVGAPAALLLFALFVLRQARARRVRWRTLLRQWIVTMFSEVAMEVVGLYRLGTALSYV